MTVEEFAAALDPNGAPPAGEEEISAFEALLGQRLPDDYRAFLGRCGGGTFVADAPTYRLGAMWGWWSYVGGLRSDAPFPILSEFLDYGAGPLPQHLLWIGDDGGGNPIVLCLRPDRLGEVFIVDHEVCAYEGEPETIESAEEYGLAMLAAPSFTAFLAELRVEGD